MEQPTKNRSQCLDCGITLFSRRRQRCLACELKQLRALELPLGAECSHCNEQRSQVLRWVLMGEKRVVLCHNCYQLAMKLRPTPMSMDEVRSRLQRDIWSEEQRVSFLGGQLSCGELTVEQMADELDALADELLDPPRRPAAPANATATRRDSLT